MANCTVFIYQAAEHKYLSNPETRTVSDTTYL
jgi:hypothetical protein